MENSRIGPLAEIGIVIAAAIYPLSSFVHIYSSELSGTNFVVLALLPFALVAFMAAVLGRTLSYGALGLVLLCVLAAICVLLDPVSTNAKLLRGALVGAIGAYGAVWISENRPALVPICVGSAIALTMAIATAQASYLFFGVGLNPVSDEVTNSVSGLVIGIPSAFGNPNDFSVFLLLILIACLWRSGRFAATIRLVCLVGIVLSGSKLALLLALLGFFMGTLKRFFLLFIPGIVIGAFLINKWLEVLQIYSIQRLIEAGEAVSQGTIGSGGSIAVRLSSVRYFVENFPEFLVGSFSAAQAYPQFSDALFDVSLISVNPHSAVIELAALFGIFGLIIFLLLSVSAIGRLKASGYTLHRLWFAFLSIIGASFVPSSILFNGWFLGVAALVVSWKLETDDRTAITLSQAEDKGLQASA